MKTLRHILTWLQATMMLGILSACHDDFQSPEPIPDANIDTGISIRIPNLDATTRSETWNVADPVNNKAPLADEGKILSEITIGDKTDKDSWLFIYYAEDGKTPAQNYAKGSDYNKAIWLGALEPLPTFDTNGNKKWYGASKSLNVEGSSSEVKVPMHPGKYKIYLVANVHQYLGDETLYTEEDETGNLIPIEEDYLKAALMTFNSGTDFGNQILKPGYLPMLCQPKDVEEGETFEILSENVKALHCNMEFLCAKVRYTVLFDNNDFSKAEFGSRLLSFPETEPVTVSNVASQMKLVGTTNMTALSGTFSASISQMEHYPDLTTLEPGTGTDPAGKLAWQGIVYLPENKVSSTTDNGTTTSTPRTTLTFNSKAKTADGKSVSDNPYEVKLIEDGKQNGTDAAATDIERGHFYDLCIKATSLDQFNLSLTVDDWSLEELVYSLQGPYYLEVEKTVVPVTAGQTTAFWFDSDTKVTGLSPQIEVDNVGKIDVYIVEPNATNDSILVKVNPLVPANLSQDEKDKISYFELKAGNLKKEIKVSPLEIGYFESLSPKTITIDLREMVSSGIISDEVVISYGTNRGNVKIELPEDFPNSDMFKLEGQTGDTGKASGTNTLKFSGMTSGDSFWNSTHNYTLTYTFGEGDNMKEDQVEIKIIPFTTNYKIHFRGSGWTYPHIYVYQCLTLPADLGTSVAGRTVGFQKGNNFNASLEYSFTGKMAFKGWQGYGGPIENSDITNDWVSDPYSSYREGNGFIILKDGPYSTSPDQGGWDYVAQSNIDKRYYLDMDFCSTHRSKISCSTCKGTSYAKSWPGIQMLADPDNSGWWIFELTGVASPGKTLIMFADEHGGTGARFPDDNQVGVPLFDYPDREGWFDYNGTMSDRVGNNFTDNNPDKIPFNSTTFRIYWKYDEAGYRNRCHVWWDGHTSYPGTSFNTDSENGKGPVEIENVKYYYFDVTTSKSWNPKNGEISLKIHQNNDNQAQEEPKVTFTAVSGKSYQYEYFAKNKK